MLTVDQPRFSKAVNTVARAVASRSTLPVLSNIGLWAQDGTLTLAATDLEKSIKTTLPVEGGGESALTIPARLLADLVSSLQGYLTVGLDINEEKQGMRVRYAGEGAQLKGISADEFPVLPSLNPALPVVELPARFLKSLIERVAFCAAKDESRPVLTGIYTVIDAKTITLATADGFRLAVTTVTHDGSVPTPITALVPARTAMELAKLLGEAAEDATVRLQVTENRNQLIAEIGPTTFVTQLLEGNFPDYRQIIPKSTTSRLAVNGKALKDAVRRVTIFARDAAYLGVFTAEAGQDGQGTLSVSGEAAEVGNNKELLPVSLVGPGVETAYNLGYVEQVVSAILSAGATKVAVGLTSGTAPGVFTGEGLDGLLYVIMPMNIQKR
jgi:DNA polymerase-3 subunit beta